MIVLDDKTCPIGMLLNIEHFFAQESCGWCTPCWAGLRWIDQILRAFEAGQGKLEDIDRLQELGSKLAPGHTFCALAPGAAEPLNSGIKYFRDVFEQHIHDQHCPWRA
jgi:NADH-quinone oxidoreductase subunit F